MSNSVNLYLSDVGFYFVLSDIKKFVNINKLKTMLTVKRSLRIGSRYNNIERYLYKIIKSTVGLLFVIAKNTIDDVIKIAKCKIKIINKISEGETIEDSHLEDGIVLDKNQKIVSKYIDKYIFEKENGRMVLVMNTGLGKTYIAAHKIKRIKQKTLIIVPSKNILEEWVKALSYYTNLIIGCYYSDKKMDGDVVIMTVQSAMGDVFKFSDGNIKYYEYFKKFGFAIYDEIHSYVSAKRENVFWRINTKYVLGLTATPSENAMKLDILFEKHCGNLVHANDIENFNPKSIKWHGEIHPIKYYGLPKNTEKLINSANGWTSHGLMVKQFIADENRNNVIIDLVERLYKNNRNIFIFFELREYAFTLSEKINERLKIIKEDKEELSILMGGASKDDIENSHNSQIILTTYGWGYQGLSIPKMDTIIFATPRKAKMAQIIGRILRKSGDSSIKRHIYDIIDCNTDLGKNQHSHRKNIFLDKTFYNFEMVSPIIIKIQE